MLESILEWLHEEYWYPLLNILWLNCLVSTGLHPCPHVSGNYNLLSHVHDDMILLSPYVAHWPSYEYGTSVANWSLFPGYWELRHTGEMTDFWPAGPIWWETGNGVLFPALCVTQKNRNSKSEKRRSKTQKKQKETHREGGLPSFPKPLIPGLGGHKRTFPKSFAVGGKMGWWLQLFSLWMYHHVSIKPPSTPGLFPDNVHSRTETQAIPATPETPQPGNWSKDLTCSRHSWNCTAD